MEETARNAPCPCGSGLKYKRCHGKDSSPRLDPESFAAISDPDKLQAYQNHVESLHKTGHKQIPSFMEWLGKPNPASQMSNDLHTFLAGKSIKNEAHLNQLMQDFQQYHNQKSNDDFLGLNPSLMRIILNGSLAEKERLVALKAEAVKNYVEQIPLLLLANFLLPFLQDKPIKLSEAGYLPTALVAQLNNDVFKKFSFWQFDIAKKVTRELDLPILHQMRNILQVIGLIKIRKNELSLTQAGKDWLKSAMPERYITLYQSLIYNYDWALIKNERVIEPHPHLQASWLFILWMLKQRAVDGIEAKSLAELWIKAFPNTIADYNLSPSDKKEPYALMSPMCFIEQMIRYYGFEFIPRLLGLINFKPWTMENGYTTVVQTTDFFDSLFHWQIHLQ